MVLVSIIIAVKTEHPEKLVMFIPSIPTFSGLKEELSHNVIPRVRRNFLPQARICLEAVPQFTVFSLHGNCTSRDCVPSLPLALCTYRCKTIIWTFVDVCPKRLCVGITTLPVWHNNNGHSLIGRLYLAIIASNDCPEYVYHTMSSITDFKSCSALGFLGSQLVVNGQSVVKFPLARLRRSTPTL